MNGIFPFAVILSSTALGMAAMPLWSAATCGVVLAIFAAAERTVLTDRALKIGKTSAVSVAASASILNAQLASIGAFAAGRLIGGLLI